jgi:hypothetical protein
MSLGRLASSGTWFRGCGAVIGAKDEQIAVLTAALEAALERERRLALRRAEVERRLAMDSTGSGTPSSKERIGAKEARRARQQSERECRQNRKRGGQPGHQGKGLEQDPDPGEKKDAGPSAQCRKCGVSLDGAPGAPASISSGETPAACSPRSRSSQSRGMRFGMTGYSSA